MVTPGRAFLRRLIDLTAGVTRPHHHIRFNNEAKNDIRMWLQFLDNFNGRAFFSIRAMGYFIDSRIIYRCRGIQGVRRDIWKALVLWSFSYSIAQP